MAPRIRKHDSPSGHPCMCDTFDKVYCPDCELTLHEADEDQLLQHLKDRDSELEKPLCGKLSCAFCELPFSRRASLIQHYESGPCRSILARLNSLLERLISLPLSQSLDIYRLWAASIIKEQYPVMPPAIATERSWNARTKRYKCYLCITDHLGFMALSTLNVHLASGRHAAGRYQCPYCRQPFHSLPGLVQHIETRTCQCMRQYNWHAFYVVERDKLVPSPTTVLDGDNMHFYYTRGGALRLVEGWVYARDSRWRECIAWAGRACVYISELRYLFWSHHELVYAVAGALVLGLGCAMYLYWVR